MTIIFEGDYGNNLHEIEEDIIDAINAADPTIDEYGFFKERIKVTVEIIDED